MQHHPITTGDLAMSMAQDEKVSRKHLEQRVANLEAELEAVRNWSEEIAQVINALAAHVVYGGDDDTSR